WPASPSYVKETIIPALDEGVAKAGRSRPWVTALVPVALASKGRDAAAAVVATMGTHLRLPHYADMPARSGTEVDLKDLESTTRSLLEAGTFLFDTPEGVSPEGCQPTGRRGWTRSPSTSRVSAMLMGSSVLWRSWSRPSPRRDSNKRDRRTIERNG